MQEYQWERHPKAEQLLLKFLDHCVADSTEIADLQKDLLEKTSTRLFDWVDHFIVAQDQISSLTSVGFVPDQEGVYYHPGALLPRCRVDEKGVGLAVKAENITDYLLVKGIERTVEGTPLSGFRRCLISQQKVAFWVIERRGSWTMQPCKESADYVVDVIEAKQMWKCRPRFDLDRSTEIAKQMVAKVGKNRAAWGVLEVERQYWENKNRAAQVQRYRQDRLGLGWANHDHHTFRSSRKYFKKLVQLFEVLGFHCRERFYAGKEAGWGAQVMENNDCNAVLFLDVDLDPEELAIDFAHQELQETDHLGTIGLWCALHGDSILEAGMHHLEAQFLFDELQQDLQTAGVKMMDPFSDFPYLKQAFTEGERWPVEKKRVEELLGKGLIDQSQASGFLSSGAVGSHLENLQRRDGYKGFNQKNVSVIIKKTDPRTLSS